MADESARTAAYRRAVARVGYRSVVKAVAGPGKYDEQKHPRAQGGKFGDKPDASKPAGAPGMAPPPPPVAPAEVPAGSSKVWDEAIARLVEEGRPFNKATVQAALKDMGLDPERASAEMAAADPKKLQAQYAAHRDNAANAPHEETRHGSHTVWQLKPGSASHPLEAEKGVDAALPDFDAGPAARQAFEAYTSNGKYEGHAISADVNAALRSGADMKPEMQRQVDAMRSAMRPTTSDLVAYRAVDADTMRTLFGDDYRSSVGATVADQGFVSLGADPEGVKRFLGQSQKSGSLETTSDGVLLRVRVPAGTMAYRVGSGGDSNTWASEREMVLDAGQAFKVVSSGEVRGHQSHADRQYGRSGQATRVLDVEVVPAAKPQAVRKAAPARPAEQEGAESPEANAQAQRLTSDFAPELVDPDADPEEDPAEAADKVAKDAMMQMQDVTVNSPLVVRARRRKRRKAYESVVTKHRAGQHDQLKHGRRGGQPGRGERRKAALDAIRQDYERARDNVTPERKARGEKRIAEMEARSAARQAAKVVAEKPKPKRVRKPSTPKDPTALAERQAAQAEKPDAPTVGYKFAADEPEPAKPEPKPRAKREPKPKALSMDKAHRSFDAAKKAATDLGHIVQTLNDTPTAYDGQSRRPIAELFETDSGWKWEPITHPDRGFISLKPGEKTYGNRALGDRVAAKLTADGFGHHVRNVEARYNAPRGPVDPYSRAADRNYDVDRNDDLRSVARRLGYRLPE